MKKLKLLCGLIILSILLSCSKEDDENSVQKLEWDFGKLDQEWQKERYCPLYNPTSGVRNTFMMNKFDFNNYFY